MPRPFPPVENLFFVSIQAAVRSEFNAGCSCARQRIAFRKTAAIEKRTDIGVVHAPVHRDPAILESKWRWNQWTAKGAYPMQERSSGVDVRDGAQIIIVGISSGMLLQGRDAVEAECGFEAAGRRQLKIPNIEADRNHGLD